MRRAIDLARTHVGRTAENPSVGCVIVRNGAVVGEGVTGEGGRPHAEEQALQAAGDLARGATAYVTLEPCARRSAGGASCSELLVAAGVARVVIAAGDSSVFAGGEGCRRLHNAGIVIDQGLLEADASTLYAAYRPAKTLESRR
ncbi:MAG: bifunctional diaminohydroxyphosphoribosylaminopyrimidine deaminase/5-amino-6-(5-phosphoribosylamino)uracil reductase RibD [Alphaproteobacteria bacterium]|nr:bifunctional diaminohydroxyphosphoribosylaminopyrimidine deaminase/5-amino-6-(5-phosphoribosylamino)uracil reductase RibD [Alphaproteobacteria bacterium]MBU1514368.1 bifunctional diaminohydroxyphosphoribosylaminopyrimidine deaminase/5-amino-6-(5-phosphoribosylamino)uracil reductase RibD [Alphaproteobacteria bacterium]MBU2096012.1 bifunctional diaminohydroxyphosphoribosylaminopyrimidine deaminase/5-amino-6-(5-phosphoribosylamino)uracil reductase RibD [Alphaproteobacteria bacterium]MBU2150020.1